MIQRKPMHRLGGLGFIEIKEHPWFKDFDWEMLRKKEMKAPFIPNVTSVFIYGKLHVK